MTPRPVLILTAISAGGTAATGVLSAAPGVPGWVTLTLALVTAVSTAVGGVLVQGQVVPDTKVAAIEPAPGEQLVAGKAGPVRAGKPVDVTAAGPSPYGVQVSREELEHRPPITPEALAQDPPYSDGHGLLQRRRDLDVGDWLGAPRPPCVRLEHGQATGTILAVAALVAAAVAVLVVVLLPR